MSKSNEVYQLVINRLVNAHYRFGDRFLVKELGEETGASRQPIMSALNRLSVEGFVQIIPQVGCQVIDPSASEIGDFFKLFQRAEGLLAELAAQRRTTEDIDNALSVQQRLRRLAESDRPSAKEYARLNREFHHAIHLMAHSPLLDRKQQNNFNMSDFFITQSVGFNALIPDAVAEHDKIIDAVQNERPERARLEAESHIAGIADAVLAGFNLDIAAE